MPKYRIIFVGRFCGPDGGPALVGLPEFGGATAAGFYTTRVVEAPNVSKATELAADSVFEELSGSVGKEAATCKLEVERCEELAGTTAGIPTKGFSFFSQE